jgi:hypothetical protein
MDANKSVRIMCPALNCRTVLAVPESARGKTVRCKACGSAVQIPQASARPDANRKAG